MIQPNPKTIVFVTGAFVGNNCWDEWKIYFEKRGYKTIAEPWPYKNESVAELRKKHPLGNEGLTKLRLIEVVDHYANIVKSLPEKPIVIGHSIGGLVTQIIVNRDLAAVGVAIHPVPPQGIIPTELSFYKAGGKALGLFTSLKKTYLMSFKDWQYAFVNGMPLEQQKASYEQFTIPESKRVTRGGLTSQAKVDFKKAHAPLLILSGSTDNIIPAHLNLRNFRKYAKREDSVLEYVERPDRNHFVLGQPGWEGDAELVLQWVEKQFGSTIIKPVNQPSQADLQ
ncbi:MAG: alpha/beta hydrolase [Bacteroidetes bacterium]|nr:MAG: alpha/beta hydrolase [Bacteroidota bacterium]